jgi:hypothetical protein
MPCFEYDCLELLPVMNELPPPLIPVPLDTIRRAYHDLGRLVNTDLLTQVGDAAQLGERKRECLNLLHLIHQECTS